MIFAASPSAANLLVELGAVLIALAVLGRVASRFGIPSIPLYLLAGLAVGEGGVVDLAPSRDFIETGAQIGVILLLLLLGLEYTGAELTGALRSHAPSGAVDLVLNFTPGLLVGVLLGWDYRAALLLGGVTYISSSGIIARLLEDLGNTGNRETPTVLAILVTEDLKASCRFADGFAAEHVALMVADPWKVLPQVRNAGEILLGDFPIMSLANYAMGINAILPTGGWAKTSSGVSVDDFTKRTSIGFVTDEGYGRLREIVPAMSEDEGFSAHHLSVLNWKVPGAPVAEGD